MAIHYYGATEAEQAELEKAVEQDEANERTRNTSVSEKGNAVETEMVASKA